MRILRQTCPRGNAIGLASGCSVARLRIFERESDPQAVALEYRLVAFGYTLLFAGRLPGLRGSPAANRDTAFHPSTRKDPWGDKSFNA